MNHDQTPPPWPFPTGKPPAPAPKPRYRVVTAAAYIAQANMAERMMADMLAQMLENGFVEVAGGVYERRDADGTLLETVSF